MTQTTNKEKGKKEDKVLFSKKVVFEIREIDRYSEVLEEWILDRQVQIDGVKYTIADWGNFSDVLESLKKKIDVLRYINDSTYEQIKLEILLDIGRLLYKLEYNHRY